MGTGDMVECDHEIEASAFGGLSKVPDGNRIGPYPRLGKCYSEFHRRTTRLNFTPIRSIGGLGTRHTNGSRHFRRELLHLLDIVGTSRDGSRFAKRTDSQGCRADTFLIPLRDRDSVVLPICIVKILLSSRRVPRRFPVTLESVALFPGLSGFPRQ